MYPKKLDVLLTRLANERSRRDTLRTDYRTITDSRFHALRMLWFSAKQTLGFRSPRDRYAACSPGIPAIIPTTSSRSTDQAPLPLIDAWKQRMSERRIGINPAVTIVIPVYNHLDTTARCLHSIAQTWFDTLDVQIVLIDDGSDDASASLAAELPGLDLIRNGANLGFIHSCNRGAAIARGRYICFLNNDTIVTEGWLDHLVSTAESDPSIGAVGSKLIYPDGKLQEAGNIIFRDGSGWNYGRNGDPSDPRYSYVRDVDYCSGAALLVRADLFRALGSFAERYAPAYYEDADLCMNLREHGYRVVFQPRSVVIHAEGVSSGTQLTSGTKRYQVRNQPIFRERWNQPLQRHLEPDAREVPAAARRLRNGETILIVDTYVPLHDREAGSNRLMRIIRKMRSLGYAVIFLPENFAPLQPYTSELQALGVEVLHHVEGGRSLTESLDEILPLIDFAWICRPELFAKYEPLMRRNPRTACIYDTIDLHFVRMRREIELHGGDPTAWRSMEASELALSRRADTVIVVTEEEQTTLQASGIERIVIVPTLHEPEITQPRSFENSGGLLFIGNYNHTPNVDAAHWLCDEIMPRVWKTLPNIPLTLAGCDPKEDVLQRQSELVRVTGYIPDVAPYFERARVFVAALRYGAGHKGKVGQALSFGLPTVMTPVAAEGFAVEHERECLIAENAEDFAAAIVSLYNDAERWNRFSQAGLDAITMFSSSAIEGPLRSALRRVPEPALVA